MPNFRTITVSPTIANNGVPITGFSGDGALAGPLAIVIFASNATPLTPNDPTVTIQLFPSGHFASGTDGNGNISVTATLVNTGDDENFSVAGGGTYFKAAGLWSDQIRAVLVSTAVSDVEFDLQYSGNSITDLTSGGPPTPTPVTITNITNPDAQLSNKMDVTVRVTNPGPAVYHALIMRAIKGQPFNTAVMVGTTPLIAAGTFDFIDVADNSNNYDYYIFLYDDAANISANSTKVTTNSVITADPSGLYQIVPGKTHDTLYNIHATPTTTNVAIPVPFIKTGFLDGGG